MRELDCINAQPIGLALAEEPSKFITEETPTTVVISGRRVSIADFGGSTYNTCTTGTPPTDGCVHDTD